MRNWILSIIVIITPIFSGYSTDAPFGGGTLANRPFGIGEELTFRVKYGWFNLNIAEATVGITSETIYESSPAYQVNVVGRTVGLAGLFGKTVDRFEALVGKEELKPLKASQDFQEGKKRDIQTNYFDFEAGQVRVEKIKRDRELEPRFYDLDEEAFDMLSSYLYLRSVDFSQLNETDSVMIKVFFGKRHYDFGLEYGGTEVIKTKVGKVTAHKLYILFPVSSTFPEEKSVMVWTTADENQLPLKIQAHLKFGKVTCELVDYSNLKYEVKRR